MQLIRDCIRSHVITNINKANIFLVLIEYELNSSLLGASHLVDYISVHIRFDLKRYLLNIVVFGAGLNCYKVRVTWSFLLDIRVTDDECRFSFWYIEVSAYYVYNLVYLCRSLLEQQI